MESRNKVLREFGSTLLTISDTEEGMQFISENSRKIMKADRCSIFMFNKKNEELYTSHADGVDGITVPYDLGIVGQTLRERRCIIENEAYDNRNFLFHIDIETGYYTQNILTAPIFDSHQKVIGVLQLLNKEGGFDRDDIDFITFLAHYISGYIELMGLHSDLKAG